MPDSRASHDTPRDWGDAFAALPLETPPADAWTTVARRLPDARRTRRPYWMAMAATLVLAAAIPVWQWNRTETSSITVPVAARPSPRVPAIVAQASDASSAAPKATDFPRDPSTRAPLSDVAAIPPRTAKAPRARAEPSARNREPAVPAAAAAEPQRPLETLYAESARLESILAQLQEPRVASATAAVLSAELQDRIVHIDSALSQPDLSSASQLDLWQQRVDALRQLTGVETTQRWMAAQGTATEGPWTQVY